MLTSPNKASVVVIGGGTMGADIARLLARAGCKVTLLETAAPRRRELRAAMADSALIKIPAREADVAWKDADLVIEAVREALPPKRALFAAVAKQVRRGCLIVSNSSGFPISDIAAGIAGPERTLGLHFFMPPHLVPLVEVVLGRRSSPRHARDLARFMRQCGMVPVIVRKDLPGFLANRLQHAMGREAFALIEAKIASPEDVDTAVRFGFGFRFLAAGPVLQRDHAGLDIHCAAAATIYPSLSAATAPAAVLRDRVEAGKLGMEQGEGFFKWTAESAAAERERYQALLVGGLGLLAGELPKIHGQAAAPRSAAPAGSGPKMDLAEPLILSVAPNGSYKTPADHPRLPLTPAAIAATAKRCLESGAALLHLHVRDRDGRHTLDAAAYDQALWAVRKAVGTRLVVQITTESGGCFGRAAQMAVVRQVHPEAVSVGLRELDRGADRDRFLSTSFGWLRRERIMTQVILYNTADVRRWAEVRQKGIVPDGPWFVLFVLGRYSGGVEASPGDLLPLLRLYDGAYPWGVCAFGARENACALLAASLGGHVRVGFENNLRLRDGSIAPDNAALVAQAAEGAAALGRRLAGADEIRARFR